MEGGYIKTQLDDFLAFPARLFGFTDRQHFSLYDTGREALGSCMEYDEEKEVEYED